MLNSTFQWFGDRIIANVMRDIDVRAHQVGQRWQQEAQRLAPRRTGALAAGLHYQVVATSQYRRELILESRVPYGIFQEFGTRYMQPHPHMRPALNAIKGMFGITAAFEFEGAGYPNWTGLYAGIGKGGAGFSASASPNFKPLTAGQKRHVRKNLIPSIKAHNVGHTRRATMRVKRHHS